MESISEKNIRRLPMFERRCLRVIGGEYGGRISSYFAVVSCTGFWGLVFRTIQIDSVNGACFTHIPRMTVPLYAAVRDRYRREGGSRWPVDDMWKNMRTLTTGLGGVRAISLSCWAPWDSPKRGLESIGDTAQCNNHWHFYIRNVFSLICLFNTLFPSRPLTVRR